MANKKPLTNEYSDFIKKIGYQQFNGTDITHDGYPLSQKEAIFINMYVETGDLNKALREAHLQMRSVAGKDYLADEIKWRMDQIKKETIADADEIMQYLTRVMRNQEKDQFNLDAPLAERTNAAKELARRVIDPELMEKQAQMTQPEIKVTVNWDGMKDG